MKDIWKDQKRFNSNFLDFENMEQDDKVEQTKEYILHLHSEADELLREMAWKNHRKTDKNIIKSNMKEELIDIFKYWLSIVTLWDFSMDEMIEEYWRKSKVVEQRYKQEKALDFESSNIIGVDIDGVLAAYPEHFLNFINKEIGTDYKVEDVTEYNIYEALDLPHNTTKKLKGKFRETGEKRFIPILNGAKEFLDLFSEMGYKIVLLSARPYKKYKRIFADTQEWLDKNNLAHDAILWDEDKCNRLVREFGSNSVEFFVEDNLSNANSVAKECKVYLINKPYNTGETHKNVVRVDSLYDIMEIEGGRKVRKDGIC